MTEFGISTYYLFAGLSPVIGLVALLAARIKKRWQEHVCVRIFDVYPLLGRSILKLEGLNPSSSLGSSSRNIGCLSTEVHFWAVNSGVGLTSIVEAQAIVLGGSIIPHFSRKLVLKERCHFTSPGSHLRTMGSRLAGGQQIERELRLTASIPADFPLKNLRLQLVFLLSHDHGMVEAKVMPFRPVHVQFVNGSKVALNEVTNADGLVRAELLAGL